MDIEKLFFRVPPSYSKSHKKVPSDLSGYFLISEANMPDRDFFQTVVLILEHNQNGAFGLIVNRCTRLCLGDINERITSLRAQAMPIYMGGPVQQNYLFLLHSEMPEGHEPSAAALQPLNGVFFEPSFANVEKYFEEDHWASIPIDDRPKIHLFLGYAGWSTTQLEHEIRIGSWMYHPAQTQIIFHPDPADGWRAALRQKGGIYEVFANTKQEPSLN